MSANVEKISYGNVYTYSGIEEKNNKSIKNNSIKLEYANDSFKKQKVDGSSDNKFTFKEAAKNFLKGVVSPVKAVIQHPVISLATIAVCAAVCTAIPVLTPVMAVGFGALSAFQLGKGVYNSVKEYKNGNYDNAEKAFQDIGAGTVGVVTSAIGIKQSAKIAREAKMMNELNTNILTAEQKAQVAQNISKNSFLDNIKEITSLATTKEGRAAVVSQFKPNAMKAKLTQPNVKTGKKRKISEQERIKDFKKSQEGIRRANLSDEQIQQEFQAHFDKAFDEMGIPKDQRPKLKIIDSKETLGGRYTSDNNVLSLNKNAYKAGVFELDDVCAHEATHYKESLLRARLSQDKVNQTVQDELISRIMNGESEEIIKSKGVLGAETMKPPKMNSTMRADFAELAKSKMYNQANFKADDLSSELTALMDKYPDFISQYNSKDEALQILKDYSTSHNVRFNSFTNQGSVKDIAATMPALTPEEELQAVQSLKNSIPTLEGNGVNGSFANSLFGSQKAYNQYQFSPEEVLAQQNGNKHLISQLELEMQNMKNNGTLNAEQEKIILDKINRAQATIDYKTKGLEYYTKYEQHLHNPSDTKIAQELSNLEKELKTLEDATKARKEIEIISINLPANIYALLSQLSE